MIWQKWIKPVFIAFYTIALCIGLPFCIVALKPISTNSMTFAWFIGGLFVLGAIPISIWTILEHLISYTKPYLQLHIIRILWMVPIYAVNAWFALRFPEYGIYFDTLRECYEAYAIYNFLTFLLNYLRRKDANLVNHLAIVPQVKHLPPPFIEHCRHGVLQYTVIRPITTIVALICEGAKVYQETNFSPKYAYLYLTIINNISQIWALYCLVLFYQCTRAELKEMKPISKFICVKFVVFMSFWQSVLISILAATGVIRRVEAWKLENERSICINFLVCIEMFIAAVGHHFAFTAAPYQDASAPRTSCCYSWWSMLDISDVKRDVVQHVRHVGTTVGFIGSDSRIFRQIPRADVIPGLARSPASFLGQRSFVGSNSLATSRIHTGTNDIESQPLIGDGDSGDEALPDRRNQRLPNFSDRLAPDTPWNDDDDDEGGSSVGGGNFVDAPENVEFRGQRRRRGGGSDSDDDAGFVFVRPEFISVPQESPEL
ncbi:unnamed protein product [Rodentolepis nana]|uniref:Transmembrane protein 184C n=1 Tax=Rodentolepis nana TaxID=102285 RepID=A0A0R3TSP7_RODNA|nr:unnamed protein product [Rodentolepis nana]